MNTSFLWLNAHIMPKGKDQFPNFEPVTFYYNQVLLNYAPCVSWDFIWILQNSLTLTFSCKRSQMWWHYHVLYFIIFIFITSQPYMKNDVYLFFLLSCNEILLNKTLQALYEDSTRFLQKGCFNRLLISFQ